MADGTRVGPLSLGKGTLAQATYKAAQLYAERRTLHEHGLPQPTRPVAPTRPVEPTFGDAAKIAIERLDERQKETLKSLGYTKANKFTVRSATIRRVLVPAFENTPWPAMRQAAKDWLPSYRVEGGARPSQSTVGNVNHALQEVNRIAIEKGWITDFDKPTLSKRGFEEGAREPAFTWDEVEKMQSIMSDEWVSASDTTNRRLLRFYVALLATSGIRPGGEIETLVEGQFQKEKNRILITIKKNQAKYKKARTATCVNGSFDMKLLIDDIVKWRAENWKSTRDIKESSIFANPATGRVPSLDRKLAEFLKDHNLTRDPVTGMDRVPYSFRHFAITQALLDGNDTQTVCKIFGTSSAMIEKYYSHVTGVEAALMAVGKKAKPQQRFGF
jgi:integrase